MGKYKLAISDTALKHLVLWKKSGQQITLRKIQRIFDELSSTPFTGVGSPEPLKYNLTECWSRQIDKKNRIIYQVKEEEVTVLVVSAMGHYLDK